MNHETPHVPERSADEAATEQQILERGLTAPRLSPEKIDSVIVESHFHTFRHLYPNSTLTICLLTLTNGYHVIGESSSVSSENFDPEIGRDIAYRNARDKIWALEGYLLREQLSKQLPLTPVPVVDPSEEAEAPPISSELVPADPVLEADPEPLDVDWPGEPQAEPDAEVVSQRFDG